MRKLFVVSLLSAVTFCVPNSTQAQTAKEIIKKVIEANGGEETLKKYPAAKITLKGTMNVMGMDVSISGEDLFVVPGMKKNTIHLEIGGQKATLIQVYNNGKSRMTVNGRELPVSTALKDEMKQVNNIQAISQCLPLLDEKIYEVSTIEKPDNVDDMPVVGLLVKAKGYKDVKLFFDAKTHFCVKIERRGLDPQEKEVKEETFFKGYKKIKGIPQPTKTVTTLDGKKFAEIETTDIQLLEKIDKKEFDVSD